MLKEKMRASVWKSNLDGAEMIKVFDKTEQMQLARMAETDRSAFDDELREFRRLVVRLSDGVVLAASTEHNCEALVKAAIAANPQPGGTELVLAYGPACHNELPSHNAGQMRS